MNKNRSKQNEGEGKEENNNLILLPFEDLPSQRNPRQTWSRGPEEFGAGSCPTSHAAHRQRSRPWRSGSLSRALVRQGTCMTKPSASKVIVDVLQEGLAIVEDLGGSDWNCTW